MRLLAFSIYDVKVESYFPPFFTRTLGEALRTFADLLEDPSTVFAKHRGDYRLFSVGEFHQDTGVIVARIDGVVLVEDGLQLVKEA